MKNLLLLCLLFSSLFTLSAQVSLNPKIGLNASGLDARIDDFRSEARAGWNAGFDLRIGERMIFFQPGIHIYNLNAELSQEPSLDDVNFLQDQSTIQLVKFPVNMGIRLTGTNGLLNLYALAGFTPTLLAGVKESSNFSLSEEDINDYTYGANLGAGLDLFFLTVDVRYEVGLNDFYANSPGKNNILTANVGIRF